MRNIDTNKQVFDRKCTPKLKKLVTCFVICFAFLTFLAISNFAQTPKPAPTPKPRPKSTPTYPSPTSPQTPTTTPDFPDTPKVWQQKKKKIVNESEFPAEKSIEVDSKVNIYLSVCDGNIKVNGWDRNEIRAYVKNGSEVGFKVTQKNPSTGKPIILNVLGYDPQKTKQIGIESCLSGEEIELDVPHGAYLSIESQEGDVNIYSVRKTQVKSLSGNIWLSDISNGTFAQTFDDGDVTIENSKGNLQLFSTNGNVTVLNVEPLEVDDKLQTKTNGGTITMQSVQHSQVTSISHSGIIKLASQIVSGGQYKLITNGAIMLLIPSKSSLVFNAVYGNFQSDIPLTLDNISKNPNSQLQTRTGQIGSGDASVTMQTSGIIRIKKSN